MILDPEEVWRINRIVVAEFLGIEPARVDAMPQADIDDVLGLLWARQQLAKKK